METELRIEVAKFRAWDIRNKKMVNNALIISEKGQLITVNAEYFNSPFSFFDGCKWMQHVTFNNGQDVYEGDIVTCDSRGLTFTCEVVMTRWGYDYKPINEFSKTWEHMLHFPGHSVKVIGNIYENPELREQE